MDQTPYLRLAERLNALPNGFPATDDGAELRLLAKLFAPEEAALAAQLRATLETPAQIAGRVGGDERDLHDQLMGMAKRGLIAAEPAEGGLGFRLMPFIVGIYEFQGSVLDAELAQLFEDYYRQAFMQVTAIEPQFHRVIPVNQSVPMDIEIHPYESAAEIVKQAQAWGVVDCICRKQKALIGDPCGHPVDICMALSQTPGAFDHASTVRVLTLDGALTTLQRAADAGLAHTLGNYREGVWYICNCCVCSCGILRGIRELGLANAVARSAFVSQVDEDRCAGCDLCVEYCQFGALALDEDVAQVNRLRCVGCGLCVAHCPDHALSLSRRPESEIKPVPVTQRAWGIERAAARGLDLDEVM